MAATKTLTGQVAQILNAKEVVINLGRDQGIKPGMKFAILTDPLEIKDPTTGEFLEQLVREKTRVEAKEVHNKIAVCRTYRSQSVPQRRTVGTFGLIGDMLLPSMNDSFDVEREALDHVAPYANEYVKIGDRVARIEDE